MYVLAIDIGASSGRHILGSIENGRLTLEEIYRFPNGAAMQGDMLCWDADALWQHILKGMKKCKDLGKIPASVGVDTWGVDYMLLDGAGKPLGPMAAYRDKRTEKVLSRIPDDWLFARTGIAKQPFNTVYQLMSEPADKLQKARRCLFVPDYFHYLLSGVMVNEFTESSTSALLNAGTGTWDAQVLEKAGIPLHLFPEAPVKSGAVLGGLTAEVQAVVGYNCQVILPASHDTGSAYMAVPARDEHAVYLSSGTWSLLGVEMDHPNTSEDARMIGFTNEGAYDGRVRFLRNIMGLWMLQCIRHENDDRYSFAEMADMALAADYACTVDVGDNRFLAPASMTEEVKKALQEQGAPEPDLPQLLHCVNKSLALCYAQAIADLETLSGKKFTSINIVGGGSQSKVLNQWTADATRLPVYAGPSEGTALGNVAAQLIALGKMQDLKEARARIREDFDIQVYEASTN